MYIKWHGHACFEIGNTKKIVIDPHDGKSIGLPVPKPNANFVFVTHEHFDHNAINVISGNFKVIDTLGNFKFEDIEGNVISAYHDDSSGSKRGLIRIFKFNIGGFSFVHVGDLGHILDTNVIKELHHPDFLFIPVGGNYTINAEEAYKITKDIDPKVVVPMHYKVKNLSLGLRPVDDFIKLFPKEKIENVGNTIEFEKEDVPKETNVWVFSL
jgi:L-ascorbate metabolism protein UlaG (beta-lactamase superfamily)